MRRGIGPTPTKVRVGGLPEGRAYSAGIETFDIVGAERGEVSPEVFFTMAPPKAAAPKIAIGLLNGNYVTSAIVAFQGKFSVKSGMI